MKPLQTQFDALGSPQFLTTELAILIGIILVITLYASLRLRSVFAFFGWVLMFVALIVTTFTTFPLIWFWYATIVQVLILALAQIEYTRVANS